MSVYYRDDEAPNKRNIMHSPNYFSAFIRDYYTGKTLELVTAPQSLTENISASYTQQDVPGGSRPLINYASTGARKVSMSLKLTDELMPPGYNISKYVQELKSMVYPKYENEAVTSPKQQLTVGNLSIFGGCESVGVNWDSYYVRGVMIRCTVDLSFIEFRDSCPGNTYIAGEINFEGMVSNV
mgnify:CR=1 FL=1